MFKPNIQPQQSNTNNDNNDYQKVDYDALHNHIIEACGTQSKARTIPAYISGIYDLGTQPRPPFEALYDETDERQTKALNDGNAEVVTKNFYDNDAKKWHNDAQVFVKPLPARQAITLCITFPQIVVDIDPFFGGESNPRPLNVIYGGEFFAVKTDGSGKKEKIVQSPLFIQENTNNPSGTWGLPTTSLLHKMGSALGLLNEHNLMKVDKLGDMLGKALTFQLRIWNKPNKNGGDAWFTEQVKFVGDIPEGLPVPEFDSSFIHGINVNGDNDLETVKHLNSKVRNTIMRAENYEGSDIEKLFKQVQEERTASNTNSPENTANEPSKEDKTENKVPASKKAVVDEPEPNMDFDDD